MISRRRLTCKVIRNGPRDIGKNNDRRRIGKRLEKNDNKKIEDFCLRIELFMIGENKRLHEKIPTFYYP